MRNLLPNIKLILQFIASILSSWRVALLRRKALTSAPLIKINVTISRRWKSISIYRNLRLILKMLDVTSWNYKQSISLTKKSLIQKQVSWISAFLLLISINVSAQIAQRGTATTASIATAAAAMTINKPTGVVAGDLMIATVLQNETDNDNGGVK